MTLETGMEGTDLNEIGQFEVVFKRCYEPLCRYANKLMLDRTMAEDAVQQVFTRLWEKKEQLHIQTSIESYLYKATYNTCMNELKKNKRLSSLDNQTREEADVQSSDNKTRLRELEQQIQEGLKSLPEKYRAKFVMSRYEIMKYKDIASMLDISIKTVENQMGKALKMMRIHLSEFISVLLILLWK